jgi:hypothetical protein
MSDNPAEEGESPPTRDPSSLIFRIGDVLESHSDEIDRAYRAYSTMTFLVGALAVIVTLFVAIIWTTLPLWSQVSYGAMDAIIVGFLVYALRAQKGLSLVGEVEWEVDRFRFITTFELLPPTGKTSPERLWNSLKQASHLSDDLKTVLAEKVMFNTEVLGKSGKRYMLEVFVHDEPTNPLRRFLSKWTLRAGPLHFIYYHFLPNLHQKLHEDQLTLLVKRISKEMPVTRSDLESAKKEFEDISKRLRDVPEHAVIVSTSGYSDDALDYVKDEESDIRPFADDEESAILDLVVERNDGSFEVAYYG